MISYTPEGHRIKLGLNFSGSKGGFRLLWAWYNFATHKATTYRLRLRLHMAPRIIWESREWNVIDNYLEMNGLEVVHREVLEDLKLGEQDAKRRSLHGMYIKAKPEVVDLTDPLGYHRSST
jgi:hypothetical protein